MFLFFSFLMLVPIKTPKISNNPTGIQNAITVKMGSNIRLKIVMDSNSPLKYANTPTNKPDIYRYIYIFQLLLILQLL